MAVTLFQVCGANFGRRLGKGGSGLFPGLLLCAMLAASGEALGAEAGNGQQALTDLSLEQLMEVSVYSASRKNQTLSDVTSAVFVISQEDIRHSGATTIPDLLRMVPGVQVAEVDANSWAISIRGFNGTFANKLLVMIDGRSVYTPLNGGVFWDVQDTLLEDIERIEVIRGPGSTMWGANATNGVINIITKNARSTDGALLTGLTGSRERGTVSARYGSTLGEQSNYRLFLKHLDRGDSVTTSGPTVSDATQLTHGGFRIDSAPANNLNLTLQGDLYGGTAGKAFTVPNLSARPYIQTIAQNADLAGGNLLSRLDWLQSESSKFSLQLYYDRTHRNTAVVKEDRDTVDLDLQHNLHVSGGNELTWGAGYRFLHDNTPGTKNVFLLAPTSRTDNLLNLFLQDEIALLPERLRLIVGSKFEHNEFTGWELEPSARLLLTPHHRYSLWAAVTRSVRTPSRGEQDATRGLQVIPPHTGVPLPSVLLATGSRQLQAEYVLAYELGFRTDLSETLSLDISSFYNQYHGIVGGVLGTPFPGGGQVTIPYNLVNLNNYDSSGAEVSFQWQPIEWWKLKGGYSYIKFFGSGDRNDSVGDKATPSHQATLRSLFALGRNVDLDFWARYVGDNRYALVTGPVFIPAYATLDVHLAWRPVRGVELSLVGQNLLQQRHLETISDQSAAQHEMERSVYGKVAWAF